MPEELRQGVEVEEALDFVEMTDFREFDAKYPGKCYVTMDPKKYYSSLASEVKRLRGELDRVENANTTGWAEAAKNRLRAERAEADLAAMTKERDQWIKNAEKFLSSLLDAEAKVKALEEERDEIDRQMAYCIDTRRDAESRLSALLAPPSDEAVAEALKWSENSHGDAGVLAAAYRSERARRVEADERAVKSWEGEKAMYQRVLDAEERGRKMEEVLKDAQLHVAKDADILHAKIRAALSPAPSSEERNHCQSPRCQGLAVCMCVCRKCDPPAPSSQEKLCGCGACVDCAARFLPSTPQEKPNAD